MEISLRELAELVGGKVIGDPDAKVSGLGSLDDAAEGQITFLSNPKLADKVSKTGATAVILPKGVDSFGRNVIETANPYLAFAKVLTLFSAPSKKPQGVMDGSYVCASAVLGADVTVYPGAYIGENVSIGERVTIHSGAVIYEQTVIGNDVTVHSNVSIRECCRIGNRVIIHNGAVIGGDGFGYVPDGKSYYKIPQVGIVVIEDDVEIGANTTIDRAALDITLIKRGVKIDNLVQIAHNCKIGEDSAIAAQTGISGSSTIGRNVTISGQVAIAGHLTVGDNIILAGRCGVTGNLDKPGVYSGIPPIPHKDWLKSSVVFQKIPEMKKTISSLEKRIAELEKQLGMQSL
jgi:UDP-3-O-[3-hydroxymyristoyl] glucosamine N-acyltransferase